MAKLHSKILNSAITFVRKANTYGVPKAKQVKAPAMQSPKSTLGMERPGHKYIRREQVAPGQYKYIYKEAEAGKAPSMQDQQAMIQEFKAFMGQDKSWKRYAKHFTDGDINNLTQGMDARGVEITPETFMQELSYVKQTLGIKVSDYLPAPSAAREYKQFFNVAGNRPSEYSKMVNDALQKDEIRMASVASADLNGLKAAGFNDQQLEEFRTNPKKLKEVMDQMSRAYKNFTAGG